MCLLFNHRSTGYFFYGHNRQFEVEDSSPAMAVYEMLAEHAESEQLGNNQRASATVLLLS